MRRICTICARGGSKGVPGKNIRYLAGKPLIAHTLEQVVSSGLFDVIAVSSDSSAILYTAEKSGASYTVLRPEHLATDTAAKLPVIKHCVESVEALHGSVFDICVDLDVTSPLRDVQDIVNVVLMVESQGKSNVITATPSRRSPYFNMVELGSNGAPKLVKELSSRLVRRQDAPQCYDMNASIYAWKRDALFNRDGLFHEDTGLYVMPEERSLDIDSDLDFFLVECILKRRMNGIDNE